MRAGSGVKRLLCLLNLTMVFSYAAASDIARIPLEDLASRSNLIVLGKVADVQQMEHFDRLTINVRSTLQGAVSEGPLTLTLTTRGGLKDFDPELSVGDSAVFFLKQIPGQVDALKAYSGGVAIFPKDHFD